MLQVALGAYENLEDSTTEVESNPVYYEPGFNLMSPLEIDIGAEADVIYIFLRKRSDDTGSNFFNMTPSEISFTAIDVTNGETLLSGVALNSTYNFLSENPSANFTPLVIRIENQLDVSNPILRVRVIDCNVKDITNNNFITFRIIVSDGDLDFHYIPVRRKASSDRNTFSIQGREAYVDIYEDSDSYILFSPYSWIKEATKSKADFSYPEDSIYYNKQDTFNNEDFTFSLDSYSNSFVKDNISVMNIPSYGKAGIVLVDRLMYSNLVSQGRSAYANILVTGELSGRVDTFKVNFYKGI